MMKQQEEEASFAELATRQNEKSSDVNERQQWWFYRYPYHYTDRLSKHAEG